MLPEVERSGREGETVRRLFSRADASRFAADAVDTHELLALRPEIDNVLDRLESRLRTRALAIVTTCLLFTTVAGAAPAETLFRYAKNAYSTGDYSRAAGAFAQAAALQPAGGTLQDLGNAEWELGHAGTAILAWEQALWLDPFNNLARANLRFGRRTAQLETPELTWYEVVSSWLPANWWAWVAGLSLWVAVGISVVPGILRWRKAPWHQAAAAFGLAIFLLSVPAHVGVSTRSRLGFVVFKDAPLRLTPTTEAQFITRLAAGEPARLERERGAYLLVRTSHATGWIQRNEFQLICSTPSSATGRAQAATAVISTN
jgi:tetratricopeptide (TPR) repeat protein